MNIPNKYHEMKWSMHHEHKHAPKICRLRPEHQKHTACVQNEIPRTPTINLEEINNKGKLNFIGWNENLPGRIIFDNVDNQLLEHQQMNIGTQQLNVGDSGSGHWMYNKGVAVLIGISDIALEGGTASMIQKTTNKDIFKFIKDNISY